MDISDIIILKLVQCETNVSDINDADQPLAWFYNHSIVYS